MGETLPQDFRSFKVAAQLSGNDLEGTVDLRLSTLDAGDLEAIVVLLDVTYILSHPEEIKPADVLARIDGAHKRVEEVFEACITDKLRKRFEEVIDR